jgi:alginate O-acetyltransferase complex protein AlgJ
VAAAQELNYSLGVQETSSTVASADELWLLKDDAKVLRGKNGRLFLDRDGNQVVKQYMGELLLSEEQLQDWQHVLENRVAWLGRLGIPYLFLAPPTAHVVYPEDMPDEIPRGKTRPILQLIERLESCGSFARVIYPLEHYLAAKPAPLLYPPTNSHWSDRAAFIAYRLLTQEIAGSVPLHQLTEEDLRIVERKELGDLGYKIEPKELSLHTWAGIREPHPQRVSDNLVWNKGSMVVTHCPEAPDTTCLLFGDSFAERLIHFFAASFRRFIFVYLPTLDYELVRRERPDVVVGVTNERFLTKVAYDVGAPTQRDFEETKKAERKLRGELLTRWPHASLNVIRPRDAQSPAS